jgi:hypothetical protein
VGWTMYFPLISFITSAFFTPPIGAFLASSNGSNKVCQFFLVPTAVFPNFVSYEVWNTVCSWAWPYRLRSWLSGLYSLWLCASRVLYLKQRLFWGFQPLLLFTLLDLLLPRWKVCKQILNTQPLCVFVSLWTVAVGPHCTRSRNNGWRGGSTGVEQPCFCNASSG